MGSKQHILVPTKPGCHTVVVGYDAEANSFYGFAEGQMTPNGGWAHQWNEETGDWDPQQTPDDGRLFWDFGCAYSRVLDPDYILDQAAKYADIPEMLRYQLLAAMKAETDHGCFS